MTKQTNEQKNFLKAIMSNPMDIGLRLVYSDLLLEQGTKETTSLH